jgi:2-polyprenyl-6-methoxyphenol hydroxylase-like FAD-dependent oxidoreductase
VAGGCAGQLVINTFDTRKHAVVIGGSLAGLLSANALTPSFDRVTVLERDTLPLEPNHRAGVPQARHVHTLLIGGHRAIEAQLPGFDAALASCGAPRIDWPQDALVHSQYGWWPRYRSDLVSRFASRDLIEHTIRAMVRENPRISILERTDAVGLIGTADRIEGVRSRARDGHVSEATVEHRADLVVDASGRSSKLNAWLEAVGCQIPADTTVDAHVGYASRLYRPPAGHDPGWKLLLVRNPMPGTRGGGIYSIDAERWIVTLGGFAGDMPPLEDDGFLGFARSLGVPHLADALESAEPLSEVVGYRRTLNVLHHFDRAKRWPVGLVALGDAVCGFDPVYAQGMSVAARGAQLLGSMVGSTRHTELGPRFQASLAAMIRDPWDLAVQEDLRYSGTESTIPRTRLLATRAWYGDRVLRAVVHEPDVHRAFVEVLHLLRPASDLARPGIAARVLRPRRSSGGDAGSPAPAAQA